MGKVIILEGPDGAGKTTLARALEERGFQYVHTGPPKPNSDLLVEYATVLDTAIQSENNVVIDRLHIGESVYGPILRGIDRIGLLGQVILQRIIRGGGVLEVFCMPPYRVCFGNWFKKRAEGQELVNTSTVFDNIYSEFERLRKSPLFSTHSDYDYTKCDLGVACEILMSQLTSRPRLPPGVIGDPQASFLFIGEKANQEELDLPWVAMNNSSAYLLESLYEAGYTEREMAFTNTMMLDGRHRNLKLIIDQMNRESSSPEPIELIALGKMAKRDLAYYGFASRSKNMHHPAFWNRFHSADQSTYVKKLREIRTNRYARMR